MTNVKSVFNVVRDLILELKDIDEGDVTLDTTIESLSLDSLDFVEMQVVVQKKIAVVLDPESFAGHKISSLRQLCEYIVDLKESAAVPA